MLLIDRWLQGKQNFIVGRVLYDVYGYDKSIKELLRKGKTAFAQQRLHQALTEINTKPVKAIVHEAPEVTMFMPMPAGTDEVLVSLEAEWKPLYARMNLLRHKLDEYDERNDADAIAACEPMCKEILELEQQVMQVWKKRNYYVEHGALPFAQPVNDEIPTEPLELAKFINNCKKNIRYNRLAMHKPGADAQFAERYVKYKDLYNLATGEDYKEKE